MEPETIMEWAGQAQRRPGDVVTAPDGRRYSAAKLMRAARWAAARGRRVSPAQLARAQIITDADLRAAVHAAA